MERRLGLFILGLVAVIGMACNKAAPPPPGDSAVKVEPPPAEKLDAAPDKLVVAFLDAARSGDQKRLSELLTTKAREETAKHDVVMKLDDYKSSTFEVGEFEFLTDEKDAAHVACKWTDHDSDGSTFTHNVIWVVCKEESAWRVAGMITRPFPDKPPVVFNYEDASSLVKAKQWIIEEEERRMQEEAEKQKLTEAKLEKPAKSEKPIQK